MIGIVPDGWTYGEWLQVDPRTHPWPWTLATTYTGWTYKCYHGLEVK